MNKIKSLIQYHIWDRKRNAQVRSVDCRVINQIQAVLIDPVLSQIYWNVHYQVRDQIEN